MTSCTYLIAKQLNNSAARCIEIGHYDRAMSSLKKALEINKTNKQTISKKVQRCYQCTLDGCIAYSEQNRSTSTPIHSFKSNNDEPSTKKRRIGLSEEANERRNLFWRPPSESKTKSRGRNDHQVLEDNYIYCQPIRVDFQAGDIGGTLFLIIIFNLALAHHLAALGAHNNMAKTRKLDTLVQRTLSLYKLTIKCYLQLLGKDTKGPSSSFSLVSSVASFRFNMIIQNNISQLHRLVNDHSKYDRCRQQLLSNIMVVLDYNIRVKSGANDPRTMEIEGFLTNTTSLILGEKQCAEAA